MNKIEKCIFDSALDHLVHEHPRGLLSNEFEIVKGYTLELANQYGGNARHLSEERIEDLTAKIIHAHNENVGSPYPIEY